MEKNKLFGIIGAIVAIGIIVAIVKHGGNSAYQNTVPVPAADTGSKTYTLADVRAHNKEADCWTTINGGVYNLTSWINQHPGGPDAIISICGIDGSSAFNNQHGGQRRPEEELATFKIGTLQK